MPHFHIKYSGNLEDVVDMPALRESIRVTAAGLDAFPMPGVHMRAMRRDHCAIADGNPKNGFIGIPTRLRGGRPENVKRDINPELSPKTGNIRDHLEDIHVSS